VAYINNIKNKYTKTKIMTVQYLQKRYWQFLGTATIHYATCCI